MNEASATPSAATGTCMPDYGGGSLVNLMASILQAFDGSARGQTYPPLAALPPQDLEARSVVLLVIDGLGYGKLIGSRPGTALRRHLAARITSVFPSTTATAITTFLTGEAPQQHGVTGWFTWFAELGDVLAVLPYRTRGAGRVPALPPGQLFGHVPIFDRLRARSHVVVPRHIAYSDYNTAHNGKARIHPFASLAQMFDAIAQIVRAPGLPHERNYVYAYWPELDRLAHEFGIGSREATAQLARIDTAFDEFLQSIAGTDATVVVTADHGFIDARPEQAVEIDAHAPLAAALLRPLCGERRAAYCYVDDDAGPRFVDYVETHLDGRVQLRTRDDLIGSGAFGRGPAHPRLHERVGDFVLLAKGGATVKDWVPGEQHHTQIGVHGGTTPEEMFVPLIVARA